jgi:hypothetical protein
MADEMLFGRKHYGKQSRAYMPVVDPAGTVVPLSSTGSKSITKGLKT